MRARLEDERLARQIANEDDLRAVLDREDPSLAGEVDPVALRDALGHALARAEAADALAAWLVVMLDDGWDYAEALERAVQRLIERRRKPRTTGD